MPSSTVAEARRTRSRQFTQLYGVALAFTLVPFSMGTDAAREGLYRLTGQLSGAIDQARYSLLHNELDAAVLAADGALAMVPGSEESRAVKANALFERYWVSQDESDRQGGRELVESLRQSSDAGAYTARGNLALIEGDTLAAVKSLQQAVAADDADAYAQHQLGFSLNALGRYAEALPHFERALLLAPDMAWVQSNLVVTLAGLERCDESVPGLPPAVGASCHNQLGVLQYNGNRFREARAHFDRAVRAAPDSAMFHANLAAALANLGDRAQARVHARQARSLGLSAHPVLQALGE